MYFKTIVTKRLAGITKALRLYYMFNYIEDIMHLQCMLWNFNCSKWKSFTQTWPHIYWSSDKLSAPILNYL